MEDLINNRIQLLINYLTPGHHNDRLKLSLDWKKRTDIWHLVLLGGNILFKESTPSIMVTRNPN